MFSSERIEYKSNADILAMRQAGLVVADIHDALASAVTSGMTTAELDVIAAEVLAKANATSNFLGYYGYPGHVCISVNEEIVHGIPGDRVLEPGDLVSFDCGAVVDGWHGDACITVVLPGGDDSRREAHEKLSAQTNAAMWAGIAALASAKRVGDIGAAIEDSVMAIPAAERPGIIEEYVGHGIGTSMHQPPDVLNYRAKNRGSRIKAGMVLCIEPMLSIGQPDNETLADEWTVVTKDGSTACHWEHMVAIHSRGIWVLTAPDGGAAGLAPYGVTPSEIDVVGK